jgi:7,8-dihydropterin-6-yl-methyl-4-(beta-D-ribofuranosyl)aminobenzene 5'-phosphate synthase
MNKTLQPVDKIEILTLQDNFIDLAAMDSTAVVRRAFPIKNGEISNSISAEHGFSALVTAMTVGAERSVLFDFGFSERGALANADSLGVTLDGVEAFVLSHGHMDHHGGLAAFAERLAGKKIEMVLHPAAFRQSRYLKMSGDVKLKLPALNRDAIERRGVRVVETSTPHPLLDGALLFLGEIPKKTSFERGFPGMHYEEGGSEKWDPTEDDSAIVGHVRGKGLVILSGCAHSGIVNTVNYARAVTGVEDIFVVMGGFHLTGANFEPIVHPTVQALERMRPRYVVPTHCTGRKATMEIERSMPDAFLLNMSGTRMVFTA